MAQEVASLQSAIHAILTAPDVDLTTISAKRVRKQLLVQEPSLSEEWIRENKNALDVMIANVFTEVQPAALGAPEDVNGHGGEYEAGPSDATPRYKRQKNGRSEEDDDRVGEEGGTNVKKVRKTKGGVEMTDEEYAKQLSSELNGRPRSSRFAATKANGSRRGKGGRGKSSRKDVVDSDGDEDDGNDDDDASGKKRKKRSEGGAKGGFSKEYLLRLASSRHSKYSQTWLNRIAAILWLP
jgi:upstream activation factor subunit UAF30